MAEPANERILVTGGTGFIGRYVIERLISRGYQPLATTFKEKGRQNTFTDSNGADLVNIDLTDADETAQLVASYKPEIILHLAGTTGHNDPEGHRCQRINVDATVNLLKALKDTRVSRVVLIGTAAEYGAQQIPFRENMSIAPRSHYAISKARANEFALKQKAESGLPVTILRVFTAFGYGQPRKMFVSQLITHALLNQKFMMSDGSQNRDFVHIKDVAEAIVAGMTNNDAVGRIINIGSGHGTPLRQLARAVWDSCGVDSELLEIGAVERPGDAAVDTEADISLAREILGWAPRAQILEQGKPSPELLDMIAKMKAELVAA